MNTRRILLAALIFCASPAFAKTVSVTGVAQDQSGTVAPTVQKLSFAAGETGEVDIAITHPDGTAYNLTGAQVLFAVNGSVISRQATIDNASAGTAHVPLVIADTLGLLGVYTYDISVTTSTGAFYRVVPASSFVVTAGIGQPGQPVTVPASQQPLAQGPAGAAGATTIGHIESGQSAITEGSGAGHEWLDVTFNAPFAAATGATGYTVDAQISLTNATDPPVGWSITNKTVNGMTIQFTSTFAGELRWKAYDVANSTAVLPNPAPSVIAGTGLMGGGALSSNVTLSIASTVPTCTPTTTGDYCGWSGSAWVREPAPTGSGTVTSVATGAGLSGGPITTTGTIDAATIGPGAGTYCGTTQYVNSITLDKYGNVTGETCGTPSGGGGGSVTWTAPAYQNSWVDYGAPYDAVGFYKDPVGFVHLRGLAKNGTPTATIFTFPVGYRPINTKYLTTTANGSICQVQIDSSGNVTTVQAVNSSVSFDSLTFLGEQ